MRERVQVKLVSSQGQVSEVQQRIDRVNSILGKKSEILKIPPLVCGPRKTLFYDSVLNAEKTQKILKESLCQQSKSAIPPLPVTNPPPFANLAKPSSSLVQRETAAALQSLHKAKPQTPRISSSHRNCIQISQPKSVRPLTLEKQILKSPVLALEKLIEDTNALLEGEEVQQPGVFPEEDALLAELERDLKEIVGDAGRGNVSLEQLEQDLIQLINDQ